MGIIAMTIVREFSGVRLSRLSCFTAASLPSKVDISALSLALVVIHLLYSPSSLDITYDCT